MTDPKSTPDPAEHPQIAADDVGATAMAERAEKAMEPVVDTLAGSAEGVGSVGYDEDGVFEIGDPDDSEETERAAPGG